jgi:hypothetical protein
MGAPSIAGFGIQKRGELLTRHSRQGSSFAPETARKHHKLTSQLRGFSNTLVYYHVHHIDL